MVKGIGQVDAVNRSQGDRTVEPRVRRQLDINPTSPESSALDGKNALVASQGPQGPVSGRSLLAPRKLFGVLPVDTRRGLYLGEGDSRRGWRDLSGLTQSLSSALTELVPADSMHAQSRYAMYAVARGLAEMDPATLCTRAILERPTEREDVLIAIIATLVAEPALHSMPVVRLREATTVGELLTQANSSDPELFAAAQKIGIPEEFWLDAVEAAQRIRMSQALAGGGTAIRGITVHTRSEWPDLRLVLSVDLDGTAPQAVTDLQQLVETFARVYGNVFDLALDPALQNHLTVHPAWPSLAAKAGFDFGEVLWQGMGALHGEATPINTTQSLDVLTGSVARVLSQPGGQDRFANHIVVLVPHILKDVEAYTNAYLQTGANPEQTLILGIPYSTKAIELPRLRRLGVRNVYAPADLDQFRDYVPRVMERALTIARDTGKRILIAEDGGNIVPYIHSPEFAQVLASKGFASLRDVIDGAVEQTRGGILRDEQVNLKLPVFSVPDLELKQTIEAPFIGDAVTKSVTDFIGRLGDSVRGRQVLVMGFGAVGKATSESLRGAGAIISSWDSRPIARVVASHQGASVASTPAKLLKQAWLIVGASGRTSLDASNLQTIIDDSTHRRVYIASGSSKRIEVDTDYIEQKAVSLLKLKVDGVPIGTLYTFANGREIVLLADGYPVNFFGPTSQSVPAEHVAPGLAAIYESAALIAEQGKNLPVGFRKPPAAIENAITRDYERFLTEG